MDEKTTYLTSVETAQKLRVSRYTIIRWVNLGYFEGARKRGPGVTSGNLIPTESVMAMAKQLGLNNGN